MATPAAAVLACASAVVLAVGVPALASRRSGGLRKAGILGGLVLGSLLLAGIALEGPDRAFRALLPLAGFSAAAAGGSRWLAAWGAPRAAAAGLAALAGCALLVLPFLGDPLVEPGPPGKSSPASVEALLGFSPLAASVGGGLGVDYLRAPLAYGGPRGPGLSRIGAFHPCPYPDPARSGARFAIAGVVFLLLCGVAPVRRAA